MFPIRQGATHKVIIGPVVAVGDGFTPITTLAISSADEAEALVHDSVTVVDIAAYTWAAVTTMDGYYALTLQSAISNTVGHMTVGINDDSLCLPVRADFQVLDTLAYDAIYKDAAVMDVNVLTMTNIDFGATMKASINTEVDTSMVTYGLDHLLSVSVTGADVADNSIIADLVSKSATSDYDDYVNTTDSLQAIVDVGVNIKATDDIDLSATQKTSVETAANAAAVDVLTVDLIAEAAQGAPGATDSIADMVQRLYSALVFLVDVDAGHKEFYSSAGTLLWKKVLADDGSNYTEAKGITGA